jgi:NAD+ diphosphatase
MTFNPRLQPASGENRDCLWFIFGQGQLLIKRTLDGFAIPAKSDIAAMSPAPERFIYFGALDGRSCYAAGLDHRRTVADPLEWVDLRALFGSIREELLWVAGRANQLADWDRNHRFCGRCGGPTEDKRDERAKICPRCGQINFPRLNPAVIMAVVRNDQILLATNKRFKGAMFSVLAGFVEPGETLEDCVEREIREEVGIAVKNIQYFGSQPWLFPNSLMIGFVAEYAGGEITIDNQEITEAGWFSRSDLPRLPHSISIARRLIDWFVNIGQTGSPCGDKNVS